MQVYILKQKRLKFAMAAATKSRVYGYACNFPQITKNDACLINNLDIRRALRDSRRG